MSNARSYSRQARGPAGHSGTVAPMDATALLQRYSARLMDRRKRKAGVPTDVMTHIITVVELAIVSIGFRKDSFSGNGYTANERDYYGFFGVL